MTTINSPLAAAQLSPGGRLLRFAERWIANAGARWRAVRNRREVARLLDKHNHALCDVGVTAADVRAALAVPLSLDPSRRLAALARERHAAACQMAAERGRLPSPR